jgi:predicted RNA-binding Zn-ribbon protein involved in translation (DUF1610 family)
MKVGSGSERKDATCHGARQEQGMYETNCSSCGHVVSASFLRAGAVAVCPQCGKHWQIQPDAIRRQVTSPAAGALAGMTAEAMSGDIPGAGEEETAERAPGLGPMSVGGALSPDARAAGSEAAVGITVPVSGSGGSFLSGPLAANAATSGGPRSPSSESGSGSQSTAPASAGSRRPRRPRGVRRRTGLRLAVFAVVMIMGVGVMAWLVSTRLNGAGPNAGAGGIVAANEVSTVLTHNPTVPTLSGERLAASTWHPVDEVLPPQGDKALIRLEDAHLVVDAAGDRQPLLVGRVVNDRTQIVMSAMLQLSLINQDLRVFARCQLPLALLPPGRDTHISVPTPRELAARMVMIEGAVTDVAARADVILFNEKNVVLAPQGSGRTRLVRIKAFNPLEQSLARTHLVVTGLGPRGRVVGRWKLNWAESTPARQRIDFFAIVPELDSDTAKVEQWEAMVVAEPTSDAQALPDATATPDAPEAPAAPNAADAPRSGLEGAFEF